MYGQGWLSLKLPKINRNHNAHFISNDYLSLIQDYSSAYHASNKEKDLYNKLKDVYNGKIIHNTKLVIAPQELDIYIPQFKLGIEYNGLFWHSTKHISDINYHLNKSIVCRQKGIRLIHIYEFEDFEEQFTKLISLLNGINLFDPNDFNKNNLSGSTIPKPEIIYKDENYTIYGAGPVYKEVRR